MGLGVSRFDRDGRRLSAGLGVEIRRTVATLLFIWPPNMPTWYLVEVKKCDAICRCVIEEPLHALCCQSNEALDKIEVGPYRKYEYV